MPLYANQSNLSIVEFLRNGVSLQLFCHCLIIHYRYTVLQKKFEIHNWLSVIIFYVLLSTESEYDISLVPSRLDFAACKVTIFGKQ